MLMSATVIITTLPLARDTSRSATYDIFTAILIHLCVSWAGVKSNNQLPRGKYFAVELQEETNSTCRLWTTANQVDLVGNNPT